MSLSEQIQRVDGSQNDIIKALAQSYGISTDGLKIDQVASAVKSSQKFKQDGLFSAATAALFGLGTDAVPDDVFEILSQAALYKTITPTAQLGTLPEGSIIYLNENGSPVPFYVAKQGYEPDVARTVLEAEKKWQNGGYDLVILDVSLPDGSGYEFCRSIRKTSKVPVLFLTAADEETDIIMGLDLGGDDYITKPFKLAVFLARVNALLRRGGNFQQENTGLESNGIRVDFLRQEVFKGQERIELTAGEYRLLYLFMENPDIVLSPEQILGRLWDREENYINSSTLTVYIRRLRAKIEDDPGVPEKIVTVRRMGYRWNTAGSAEKSSGAE